MGMMLVAMLVVAATAVYFGMGWLRLSRGVRRLDKYLEHMLDTGSLVTVFIPSRGWEDDEIGRVVKKVIFFKKMMLKTSNQSLSYEDNLQAVLGSMTDGVLATDAELRVVMLNPAAERMLDLSREASVGKYVITFNQGVTLEAVFRTTIKEGAPQEMDFLSGGRTYHLNTAPMMREGEVQGAVGIFRDITPQLRLLQARRDLAANISHELRTPITSIKGLAEALMEGGAEDPEVRKKFLRLIQRESERVTRLIKDLLDLSRLESGMVDVKKQDVDLMVLLRDLVGGREPVLPQWEVDVELDVAPGAERIWADPDMLWQVVSNLLDNAIQHSPRGEKVRIAAERKGDQVRVSVEDHGPGIEPEHQDRIFERFYRVDKDRSRRKGGTGLGLSIVKHLVEAQGGVVSVQSQVGKGSTFFFVLPAPKAE